MVKKIISIVLASVFLSLTLSGCDFIRSFFEYWDGMTISETKSYIKEALKEKYGEEFIVNYVNTHSGYYYTELIGSCSPKSDETITFDFEANHFSKNREMFDNYIQNVVRKQLKQKIDDVLKENYENFASQVFVTPLNYWYDSGLRSANDVTIKNFSDSFADDNDNYTLVYIAINNSEKDFDKIQNVLKKMTDNFYSLNVSIDCYYTDEQTIEQCKETTDKSYREIGITDILRTGHFEMDDFVFFNDGKGLRYIPKKD